MTEGQANQSNRVPRPTGLLRVHPDNPRYFADGSDRAIYLTGSHIWSNLKDQGETDPPVPFDYDGYLDFLEQHNHNFIRLWTWELSKYAYCDALIYVQPFPWQRTGPGTALDGQPKFDLGQFNQEYFDRLRARVVAAGDRGIYVSIMLFEGHGLHASLTPWCWDGHPFNGNNNVNGIEGDADGNGRGLETRTLQLPAVTALQEAYVRKVIDTVNDLDNVLYEIGNETGDYSTEWQYHMINYIHEYERTMPTRHPVGMTFQYDARNPGTNANLFNSSAEWVSPGPEGGYRDDPPAADGSKVIISDTDHLWGLGGNQAWVWKSFCRGLNPIFMDPLYSYRGVPAKQEEDPNKPWTVCLWQQGTLDPQWDPVRRAMGDTLYYADRMNLVHMVPASDLASTGYCLANPGAEYLVYLPDGGTATVDLGAAGGELTVEWFEPSRNQVAQLAAATGGSSRQFTAPFNGDAVLYIRSLGAG